METNEDDAMEEDLRKAVARASEKLLKALEGAPSLILESSDSDDDDEETMAEIRSWLFRRRQGDGS
jgi:hypothetical protein